MMPLYSIMLNWTIGPLEGEEKMEENRKDDWTKFWLAWRAVCSAAACTDIDVMKRTCEERGNKLPADVVNDLEETVRLARKAIVCTNAKFRKSMVYFRQNKQNRGKCNSVFEGEVDNWIDGEPLKGCAMSLIESALYENEVIKGTPFKDYLFEDIGNRSGAEYANIYGYVNKTIRSVVRDSFFKDELVGVGPDGEVVPLPEVSNPYDSSQLPEEVKIEINDLASFFRKYIDAMSLPIGDSPSKWDANNWIALYCILHAIPVSDAKVLALSPLKHSALGGTCKKMRETLLFELRVCQKFSDKAIAWSVNGPLQDVLKEKMARFPLYGQLEEIRKARKKVIE